MRVRGVRRVRIQPRQQPVAGSLGQGRGDDFAGGGRVEVHARAERPDQSQLATARLADIDEDAATAVQHCEIRALVERVHDLLQVGADVRQQLDAGS